LTKGLPRLSFVVAARNQGRYLGEALDSLLAQTYPHIEVVVVDDGSTDETPNILDSYEGRITRVRQHNLGLAAARNHGLALAKGDYLCPIDSDDLIDARFAESFIRTLTESGAQAAYCEGQVFKALLDIKEPHGRSRFGDQSHRMLRFVMTQPLMTGSVVFHRDCLKTLGGWDVATVYGCDWDFWLKLSRYFKWTYVPELLFFYRWHGASLSRDYTRIFDRMEVMTRHAKVHEGLGFWRQEARRIRYKWNLRAAPEIRATLKIAKQEGRLAAELGRACKLLLTHPGLIIPTILRRNLGRKPKVDEQAPAPVRLAVVDLESSRRESTTRAGSGR
jgi:glycosyltransferase involved in cell wall biosynthesis